MVEDSEIDKITVAPRIRPDDLIANIASTNVFNMLEMLQKVAPEGEHDPNLKCLTLAVLVLQNGFTVVGQSACASPENFNYDIGSRLAVEDAMGKMWSLMGYHLKQVLHEQGPGDLVGSGEAELATEAFLNEFKQRDY